MEKLGRHASINGEVMAVENAKVHILTPALKYASAVFEGLRAYWNADDEALYAFRLDDHVGRLFDGMKVLRFETDATPGQVRDWTLALLRTNAHRETIHFRILAYIDGHGMQGSRGPVSFGITSTIAPRTPAFRDGYRLGVTSWLRISDAVMPPRVKCIANYQNGRLAIMEAEEAGYDYPLFLTVAGKVSETAGSCIFIVKNGKVITPDVTSDILESITRDCVLRIARDAMGLEVVERPLDRTEIYLADEAFIAGSHQEIRPVISLDKIRIGTGERGPLVEDLQNRYIDIVENRTPSQPGWCTAV